MLIVDRKLDDILKDLVPLSQQGKFTRFLTNAEDTEKISGMVDDIRDAMMEYQVRPQCHWSHPI